MASNIASLTGLIFVRQSCVLVSMNTVNKAGCASMFHRLFNKLIDTIDQKGISDCRSSASPKKKKASTRGEYRLRNPRPSDQLFSHLTISDQISQQKYSQTVSAQHLLHKKRACRGDRRGQTRDGPDIAARIAATVAAARELSISLSLFHSPLELSPQLIGLCNTCHLLFFSREWLAHLF